jgi:uncharacterized membrane protein
MNEFSLTFPSLGAPAVIVLLVATAAGALSLLFGRSLQLSPARRRLLAALRLAAWIGLFFLLANPVVERQVRKSGVPLAVVIDSSESMSVRDEGADSSRRWDEALRRLEEARAPLEKNFSVRYFTVDKNVRETPWDRLREQAVPRGAMSDLADIGDLLAGSSDVRAVLLFSDGRWGGGPHPATVARHGVPVHAVGVGKPADAPDIVVDSVQAPHFSFKYSDVEVTAKILTKNVAAETLTVSLWHGGKTVASRQVAVSSRTGVAEATLVFRPRFTGLQNYEIRTPFFRGEVNRKNNSRSFSLDVSRDRIRVLYICGRPGPNYAFLRHQLKANPTVELVTFVILRDPGDAVGVPDQELSLIPFPGQEVLFEQLPSFDIVVLEQFNFAQFGISGAGISALSEYVRKGGGLLLMGNSEIFGPQSPYRGTPLEELLPIAPENVVRNGPSRFVLTAFEPSHPVMALEGDPSASAAKWRSMPPLEGNGIFAARTRPGAVAVAGWRSPSGEEFPLLSVWPRGKGRVFMALSLTTWRWALQEAGRGNGPWAYQQFWSNTVRWLSSADDFRLVRLDLPPEGVPLGEEFLLRAFVRDHAYRPLSSAELRVSVRNPAGHVRHLTLPSVGEGEYAEPVSLDEAGAYRVTAQAYVRQRRWGQDERTIKVGTGWDENRDTTPDFSVLREMAEASGGTFVPIQEFNPEWVKDHTEALATTWVRRELISHSPWVFAGLVLVLLGDWFLRRRWGMA